MRLEGEIIWEPTVPILQVDHFKGQTPFNCKVVSEDAAYNRVQRIQDPAFVERFELFMEFRAQVAVYAG